MGRTPTAGGREKHRARLDAIGLLGKDLARRASRNCELCEGKGDLRPYDTAPYEEPTMDTVALLCERCRAIADGRDDAPETLRLLGNAIWSPYGGVSRPPGGSWGALTRSGPVPPSSCSTDLPWSPPFDSSEWAERNRPVAPARVLSTLPAVR